jgi:MFS transporter, FHS family, L-fucose permease
LPPPPVSTAKPRIDFLVVAVLNFTLFEVGLIANSLGAIIPDAIRDLQLSYTTAALLPFTYFISYLFVSIPAGIYAERSSARAVVLGSFVLVSAGMLLFAFFPLYSVILASLFIVGCGFAAAQVPLFPMLRTACGADNLPFFTVMASLSYGLGSIVSPMIYSDLIEGLKSLGDKGFILELLQGAIADSYPWVSVYWVFSIVALATLLALWLIRLPELELTDDERTGGIAGFLSVLRSRQALYYALGVFAYVAVEQVNSNWLTQFLKDYHGIAPEGSGAKILSWYWALLTGGCILGMALMKVIDSRKMLLIWSILAALSFTAALFGNGELAMLAFPVTGFFLSVLWPLIVAIALNSIPNHHGALMGVLMSSTIGGAIGPLAVGQLADIFGLRTGMTVIYPAFLFMAYLAIWSRPAKGASAA